MAGVLCTNVFNLSFFFSSPLFTTFDIVNTMRTSLFLILAVVISTVLCTVPAAVDSDSNEAAPRRRISANPDELVGKQDSFENVNVDKHFISNKDSDEGPFIKVSDNDMKE
ncbi:hypothetical protein BD408DRAFT_420141, partial [Parasitella parasitica]